MREILARVVLLGTLGAVLALALTFAARQNPRGPAPEATEMARPTRPEVAPRTPTKPPTEPFERGRAAFEREQCASCHAVGGIGNPRRALDGIAARRSREEIRDWILGRGSAAAELPPSVVKRKQRYAALPGDDLDALVAYLLESAK